MATPCKYRSGRKVQIDFEELTPSFQYNTEKKYNLTLIEKGSIHVKINGTNYCYLAPCLVAIRENVDIQILAQDRVQGKNLSFKVSFLNVNITFTLIHSGEYESLSERYGYVPLNIFSDNNPKFFGCLPLQKETFSHIQEYFRRIIQTITEQPTLRWSCRARLYLNLMLEQTHQIYLSYSNALPISYDIKDPNTWVSVLLDKIHNDYAKKISLSTLSKFIKINKTTVSKHFKTLTGYSVTDYIVHYRLKCACYALATTDISVKEIARECGYRQESYFIRQFTAKMGLSPTAYRKACVQRRKMDFQHPIL